MLAAGNKPNISTADVSVTQRHTLSANRKMCFKKNCVTLK